MKCYVCNFIGDKKEFGKITASGSEWATLLGSFPQKHLGTIDIYVCPDCGALHSDMRGQVACEDRKE